MANLKNGGTPRKIDPKTAFLLFEEFERVGCPEDLSKFRANLVKNWGVDHSPTLRELRVLAKKENWAAKAQQKKLEAQALEEKRKRESKVGIDDLRQRTIDEVSKDIGVIGNKLIRKVTDFLEEVGEEGMTIKSAGELDRAMASLEKAVKLKELLDGRPTERREENRILDHVPDDELFGLFASEYSKPRQGARSLTPPEDFDPDADSATDTGSGATGGGGKAAPVRH